MSESIVKMLQELKNKTKINWEEHEDDFKNIEIKSLLYLIPDNDCFKLLKEIYPDWNYHGYIIDTKIYELMLNALECSFKMLEDLRFKGIETHAKAHSLIFQFQKSFQNLRFQLFNLVTYDIFLKNIMIFFENVEKKFEPIFKTFIIGFDAIEFENGEKDFSYNHCLTKREKQLLLRIFWNPFSNAISRFQSYNYILEYKSFWLFILSLTIKKPDFSIPNE